MGTKEKLEEATAKFQQTIRGGDALAMNEALRAQDLAYQAYVAELRESHLSATVRRYVELVVAVSSDPVAKRTAEYLLVQAVR